MKRAILGAAMVLIGASLVPARAEGNVNFNVGQRYMSDSLWDDFNLDTQDSFGVNVDLGEDGSSIHAAFALNTSGVFDWENDNEETAIGELSAGFLWVPKIKGRLQPFLGAGVSRVGATLDINGDDSDSVFGFYANGGLFWRVTQRFNMGFDVRTLQGAKLEFDAAELGVPANAPRDRYEIDANHVQIGFLVGFGFGRR